MPKKKKMPSEATVRLDGHTLDRKVKPRGTWIEAWEGEQGQGQCCVAVLNREGLTTLSSAVPLQVILAMAALYLGEA